MSINYIFGIHSVSTQLNIGLDRIELVYFSNQRQDMRLKSLIDIVLTYQIPMQYVDNHYLDKITGQKNHQGIVAIVKKNKSIDIKQGLVMIGQRKLATILALDGITDPQNLGAILRTAECFGVDLVVLPKNNSASIDNPVVMKTSSGAINFLNIVVVNNLSRAIELCKEQGFWVAGTSLGNKSVSLDKFDITDRLMWVMGSEGSGLRRLVAEHCDHLVTIPMIGNTQSLNVSVATGVVLYYTNMFRSR